MLGLVYQYFLAQFASAEGNIGGQSYPLCWVIRMLVG